MGGRTRRGQRRDEGRAHSIGRQGLTTSTKELHNLSIRTTRSSQGIVGVWYMRELGRGHDRRRARGGGRFGRPTFDGVCCEVTCTTLDRPTPPPPRRAVIISRQRAVHRVRRPAIRRPFHTVAVGEVWEAVLGRGRVGEVPCRILFAAVVPPHLGALEGDVVESIVPD